MVQLMATPTMKETDSYLETFERFEAQAKQPAWVFPLRKAGITATPQQVSADSDSVQALVGEVAPYQAPVAAPVAAPAARPRSGPARNRRPRSHRPRSKVGAK